MKSSRGGPETVAGVGVGGGNRENRGRKYGCHAEARAVENGGKEGGREEGWRVEMMDALLSFRAP